METPEEERERLEPLERCVDGASAFARMVVQQWPQMDTNPQLTVELDEAGKHVVELPPLPEGITSEPQLNYYFGGSLATRLLAKATSMMPLDGGAAIPLSKEVRNALLRIAKPVGDVDYVPTRHYREGRERANDRYGKVSDEEYAAGLDKFLGKGGCGPSVDDLTDEMKNGLRLKEGQNKIMFDPVEAIGKERVAKITVDGQEYYVSPTDSLLAYKVLHALQKFDSKADVMARDLGALLEANLKLYGWEHLVHAVHEVLAAEEQRMAPNWRNFSDRPSSRSKRLAEDTRLSPLLRRLIIEASTDL